MLMMRKKILMLAVLACSANSGFAMYGARKETEEFDIRTITPIKKDTLPEQRRQAIQSFLKEVLKPEYALDKANILSREKTGGKENLTICTLTDGSKWVENPGGIERYLGYSYLKKAIEHHGLKILEALETRFAYKKSNGGIFIWIQPYKKIAFNGFSELPLLQSEDFYTYTRYGEGEKVTHDVIQALNAMEEFETLSTEIGFTDLRERDTENYINNIIMRDGKIYIYDTEYRSFSNSHSFYFDKNTEMEFTFQKSTFFE
ncbi:MAG: hypothetical protein K2P93_02130 [Alphaproteobacteria bacterium]|nr:hypothetical protein [Alphaproteobacteria bacterium]